MLKIETINFQPCVGFTVIPQWQQRGAGAGGKLTVAAEGGEGSQRRVVRNSGIDVISRKQYRSRPFSGGVRETYRSDIHSSRVDNGMII